MRHTIQKDWTAYANTTKLAGTECAQDWLLSTNIVEKLVIGLNQGEKHGEEQVQVSRYR